MPDPRRSRLIGRRHLIDLSPFRASPAFTRMWIGSTLAGLGGQLVSMLVRLNPRFRLYDAEQPVP